MIGILSFEHLALFLAIHLVIIQCAAYDDAKRPA